MSKTLKSLGNLELEVLKVVWQMQPCTVSKVAEIMAERRDYARTTVLTVIQRLEAKKFVKRRKYKGIYHYSTTKKRGNVLRGLTKQFVDTVLDGSPLPFVTYLAESKGLTKQQVETLRVIASELVQESGEEE